MARIPAARIQIKRAYEAPAASDGKRVLIDRLWPRGVRKEDAALDLWLKELGPSTELRQWFGHDPARWDEFQQRYAEELRHKTELLDHLREFARQGVLTLVYSARDGQHNDAVVLRRLLLGQAGGSASR